MSLKILRDTKSLASYQQCSRAQYKMQGREVQATFSHASLPRENTAAKRAFTWLIAAVVLTQHTVSATDDKAPEATLFNYAIMFAIAGVIVGLMWITDDGAS
jgi:hypothetical protein